MGEPLRIVIAEDHQFYGDGLRATLSKDPSVSVVAHATDGVTALEKILELEPHLAIIDVGLPKMDGLTVLRQLRKQHVHVDIVFLTICDEEELFAEAFELGVKGFLLKDWTSETELLACIRSVAAGEYYTSPRVTTYLVERLRAVEPARSGSALCDLTPQERAILQRIAAGKTSKEIARDLNIATKTVDVHRSNICKKLNVHGINALRRFALMHGNEV